MKYPNFFISRTLISRFPSRTLIRAYLFLERLASAVAHAYDVIEIRVPNKKNFHFGVMGL